MELITFNTIGLVLDIVGVLLLWKFGIPNDIRPKGESFLLLEQNDKSEIEKARKYKIWQTLGLILIIFGFLLQLIGNIIKK